MNISSHKISGGIALTLRTPTCVDTKLPVVVLCHGFCGIQDILLPAFAETFTQAGFATVTFDYRGFGDSDGERGRLIPSMQIDDILSVIEWVKGHPGLDTLRIGLWGTSFGGCHVFGAAIRSLEIKCIVSQLAFADGEDIVTGKMSEAEKEAFLATLNKMAEKQRNTGKEMFVNITRVLSDVESKAFFEENKAHYPKMDIKIPFLTVRETLQYKPAQNASQVTCPTLVVIAGEDTVNPPKQGKALFDAIGAKDKQLFEESGARHYDVYTGKHFRRVTDVQIAWFKKHL
ncbi:alpha/beta fold hydrolase [Salmonella enterica]|nr:alpha/beta hydrolase [Salmonella enterica]EDU6783785.1 alpha/beta hydrolase [Salmonella enterica subsp. enterica serovar Gaminara]EGB2528458.1 alpha/beta hydrolase [Salmonella enterica]EIC5002064.1 alpha/beta fold hydrolase [Salmonella enterica]EIJ3932360.1 alpha/beta fold hydrolase [Salmonella enterica]